MTDLLRDVAAGVAQRYGFAYPWRDDERVTANLRRVHATAVGDLATSQDGLERGPPGKTTPEGPAVMPAARKGSQA